MPHKWTKKDGRAICSKCDMIYSEAEVLGELETCHVPDPIDLALIHGLIERVEKTPSSEYRRDGRISTPIIVLRLTSEERDFLVKAAKYFVPSLEESSAHESARKSADNAGT